MIFKTIKKGFRLCMNYEEKDSKLEYFIFLVFQLVWFSLYLSLQADDSLSILLIIAFIMPLISSSLRCLNYLNRSRAIGFLWIPFPYFMALIPLLLTRKHLT
ncbi:hypothetical protein NB694_000441 [Pantoea ananatis]|nr:hypothetical protein [Pantoea ananatis]